MLLWRKNFPRLSFFSYVKNCSLLWIRLDRFQFISIAKRNFNVFHVYPSNCNPKRADITEMVLTTSCATWLKTLTNRIKHWKRTSRYSTFFKKYWSLFLNFCHGGSWCIQQLNSSKKYWYRGKGHLYENIFLYTRFSSKIITYNRQISHRKENLRKGSFLGNERRKGILTICWPYACDVFVHPLSRRSPLWYTKQ